MTSFKALAEGLGDAKAAKGVYQAVLEARPEGWHRVVKSDGGLPFGEAKEALEREGIGFTGHRVRGFSSLLFNDFKGGRPLAVLREEQEALASRVVLEDFAKDLRSVAGFDVSYRGRDAYAACVVLDLKSLEVAETVSLKAEVTFPYISTYLAYREIGPISECYQRLKTSPSVLLVDGNGILHPAGFGIACMVGLKLGKPTIGVAKSLLLGSVDDVGVGQTSPVFVGGRTLGYAHRASEGKPIYVSPGHLVSLDMSLDVVKGLCRGRLPEPLWLAHREARLLRLGAAD